MKLPLQIAFRGMEPSEVLEAKVRERADALDSFADDIMSCRVVVETLHKHRRRGNLFHVGVDLKVPGEEIAVSREHPLHHSHTDAYVAVRDAFDEVRRRLQDHERRIRGQVRAHAVPAHGRIALVNPDEGYGFIATPDGREVYFHAHSVLDAAFADLRVGDEVRFSEETGEKGPQATTVQPIGKHHLVS
ncbi:MAG TPA: HPF/RaiA family ribosome-associated protein [Candidatus Methanoperedens sp.]|nr:HPF/RaiA family ribosome-associated protein [Candidatus Methanoperedens sp.]